MTQLTNLKLVVYGEGLAAYQTLVALTEHLTSEIEIVFLKGPCQANFDAFYGNTTSPDTYNFNLSSSVSEPELLLNTNTSFSLGTYYQNWANTSFSWMQCFHLPFFAEYGVALQHLVMRSGGSNLNPYVVSSAAAYGGKFAHPPADNPKNPLSRAEYGYQFCPQEWACLWEKKIDPKRVTITKGGLKKVHIENNKIHHLELKDGRELQADLYIDCSGPASELLSQLGVLPISARKIEAFLGNYPNHTSNWDPYRTISSDKFGWQSNSCLQNRNERLTVFSSSEKELAAKAHGDNVSKHISLSVGCKEFAWYQNCVGIGQAASVIEPLTPAPMMLLNKDIQRLLELIPVTKSTEVEQVEYNRRFHNDNNHAELFRGAFLTVDELPLGKYWLDAVNDFNVSIENTEKLRRKISQFENRGVIVGFDLEPFNEQEWTILHFGMGRKPLHYDRLAARYKRDEIKETLSKRQNDISHLVDKMPPHKLYLEKLLQYLKSKYEHA